MASLIPTFPKSPAAMIPVIRMMIFPVQTCETITLHPPPKKITANAPKLCQENLVTPWNASGRVNCPWKD